MKSAIYRGKVMHRRYLPKFHAFCYSDTMFYLDLEELDSQQGVLAKCSKRFKALDHFAGKNNLEESVRDLVLQNVGFRPEGRIGILTHIRQFGYVMNPVSFYYCWSDDELRVEAIVAEVHNTPWGETHCYTFQCFEGTANEFRFNKDFHVSPFMDMDQEYVWRFGAPGEGLSVTMENWEGGNLIFEAQLSLIHQALTEQSFRRLVWCNPFLTIAVITRIYMQAGKLWLKKIPYFVHPRKLRDKEIN